jgi:hypothetical protein
MALVFISIAILAAVVIWVLHRRFRGPKPPWKPFRKPVSVRPGEAHLALAERWGDSDPDLRPVGDADRRVAELERRYGVSLPEDFRLYLLDCAPRGESMSDSGTTWWPIDRIRNIPDECGPDTPSEDRNPVIDSEEDRYLIFADCLVWCYAWAICCSDGEHRGKVALVGDPDQFVADSFSQFVELELNDSPAIHPGAGAGAIQ